MHDEQLIVQMMKTFQWLHVQLLIGSQRTRDIMSMHAGPSSMYTFQTTAAWLRAETAVHCLNWCIGLCSSTAEHKKGVSTEPSDTFPDYGPLSLDTNKVKATLTIKTLSLLRPQRPLCRPPWAVIMHSPRLNSLEKLLIRCPLRGPDTETVL